MRKPFSILKEPLKFQKMLMVNSACKQLKFYLTKLKYNRRIISKNIVINIYIRFADAIRVFEHAGMIMNRLEN